MGPNEGSDPMVLPAGNESAAGGCWVRMSPGRIYATFHPDAPEGTSWCQVCDRVVYRGQTARLIVAAARARWES